LWQTAKPYLERWMSEQMGWRGLVRSLKNEAPQWAMLLPQLPRLAHQALIMQKQSSTESKQEFGQDLKRQNLLLAIIALLLTALLAYQIFLH